MKKPPIKEAAVLRSCLAWLMVHGIFAWRNNSGATKTDAGHYVRYGLKGSSDILAITPQGRLAAIECKAYGKKLSPEQIEFKNAILRNNGVFILAYSIDDLEAAKAELGAA